jgi:hypothetical protein
LRESPASFGPARFGKRPFVAQDGNDLELAWDRPFDDWRRYGSDEEPAIDAPLELDDLLASRPA